MICGMRGIPPLKLYSRDGVLLFCAGMGRKPVEQRDISEAKNPDLRASLPAMRRAAASARRTAIQTGTGIVMVRDGKPVRIPAARLRDGKE